MFLSHFTFWKTEVQVEKDHGLRSPSWEHPTLPSQGPYTLPMRPVHTSQGPVSQFYTQPKGQSSLTWRGQQRPRCSQSGYPRCPPGTRDRQGCGAMPPRQQELRRPQRSEGTEDPLNARPVPLPHTSPSLVPHQKPYAHQLKSMYKCLIALKPDAQAIGRRVGTRG